MATKAELESERERFLSLAAQSMSLESQGQFPGAISTAVGAIAHLDALLQYEKRHLKNPMPSLTPYFAPLFRCAPPLFRFDALDELEAFLAAVKRAESNHYALWEALTSARSRMALASRMWADIHGGRYDSEAARRLSGDGEGDIRAVWIRLGLVIGLNDGTRQTWTFATNLDGEVQARCHNCGRRAQGKKHKFLDAGKCPRCQATAPFTIVDRPAKKDSP